MGKSFDEVIQEAQSFREGTTVDITLTTNQDNGIVAYATGQLKYYPESFTGRLSRLESLSTIGTAPLQYLLSSSTIPVGMPPPAGAFDNRNLQPFNVLAPFFPINLTITQRFAVRGETSNPNPLVEIKPVDSDTTFSFDTQPIGKLLVGLGPVYDNEAMGAVHVITFTDVRPPQ